MVTTKEDMVTTRQFISRTRQIKMRARTKDTNTTMEATANINRATIHTVVTQVVVVHVV
jgi:hypothetical protein